MRQVIKFTEVYDDFSADGRGNRIVVIGRFFSETVAKQYAKGRGNYGQDANTRYQQFTICDSLYDMEESLKDDAKAKALAKLTKEERELLGLT